MIEDRIMFKIRKEIIESLISDFNVKIDINTRQILRLNEDKIELKEYLDNEKNKNIELTNQIDKLKEQLSCIKNITKDNITQTDNLSNIISNLKVYSPDNNINNTSGSNVIKNDFKDITTEKIEYYYQPSQFSFLSDVGPRSPSLYIKSVL